MDDYYKTINGLRCVDITYKNSGINFIAFGLFINDMDKYSVRVGAPPAHFNETKTMEYVAMTGAKLTLIEAQGFFSNKGLNKGNYKMK